MGSLMSRGWLDWGVRVHLVAVQAALREEAYATSETFSDWIGGLADRALAATTDDGAPVLIAFPEAIGMPLALTLGDPDRVRGSRNLPEAVQRVLLRRWREVLTAAWRHRAFGPQAAHLARAETVYDAYTAAFRDAARRTGATVVAGTAFLPDIDEEAARGRHIRSRRVYNVGYTFGPGGVLLGRTRKAFLTRGLESSVGLSRGRVDDLEVMHAPCGRLGVAVCLDGWYDGVIGRLDGRGAEVVVQPSANDADWSRPWPADPSLTEGEAWLERGLRARLQGRLHLRYGVNPMLVGGAFGFEPRGRSSILANAGLVRHAWAEGREGVVALADSDREEAVVAAGVDLPGGRETSHDGDGRMRP